MTALTGYIQGLGGGEKRTVDKRGKEIKLSVYDDIDRVIVFNEAGETSQKNIPGTITWNQLFQNGNFGNGTNNWRIYNSSKGTLTASDNIGTITYNSSSSGGYEYGLTIKDYSITLETSHKYLFQADVKTDFDTSVAIEIGTSIYNSEKSLSLNQWSRAVWIAQRPSWSSGTAIIVKPTLSTIENGNTLQFKNLQFIDLTVLFGSETADYIYSLEQGTPGAGVAYFRNFFPDDYYAYNAGTVTSLPSPDFPQDIKGIGIKQLDGTYRVFIDYWDEIEERDGRITASGLAYPLYEGDILDFVNGKVIRANGCHVFDGSEYWNKSSTYPGGYYIGSWVQNNSVSNSPNHLQDKLVTVTNLSDYSSGTNVCYFDNSLNFKVDNSLYPTVPDFQNFLSNNPVTVVYPLASTVEEYITLSGDISEIGTATVTADGTLTVKYDKVEMAIRKYSSPPDWSKIGYSATPKIILDGFDYSKRIYDSWTPAASYSSAYRGDKALKFFPEVDITGATNYSAMFQESGLLSTPSLTIGDGSNTVIDGRWMFKSSPIEEIELTTSDPDQKAQITEIFNGCSNLKKATLDFSASGSMQYAFADCTRLERIEDGLDTSDVTSISEAFRACSSLVYLYELDLSSCTTAYRAFQNCTSLEHAPYINSINTGGNFQQMFWNCSSLKTLPPYSLHTPSNLTNMFQGTGSNLDENSRRNILGMLAACTYSGTKTLAHLGFTSSMYSAASWEALPNYSTFTAAGWSIGYS